MNNEIYRERKRKRHWRFFKFAIGIVFILILGLIIYSGINQEHVKQVEQNRSAVTVKNKTSLVLFYRDDCPDCQKIFGRVFAAKNSGLPIQLVNLNNKNNRRYIKKYQLKSIPSFIFFDKKDDKIYRYEGTNQTKIKQIIQMLIDKGGR